MENILLVDDDATLLESLSEILEDEGYSVQAVNSGKAALEALSQQLPDLMITDIMMPEMDGFQLYDAIQSRNLDVSVLFITAGSHIPELQMKTMVAVNGNRSMLKPFRMDHFLQTISEMIAVRKS